MKLIVGLGNPGERYEKNRHNIGFMTVDAIVRDYGFSSSKTKHSALTYDGQIAGQRVIAIKPQTYMNLSGQSVQQVCAFYRISIGEVVVLHDDLDLPLGRVKAKQGGGHGGHNGLRSIDAHCGKEYARIRMGIGHPGDKNRVQSYVLQNFAKAEQADLELVIEEVATAMTDWYAGGREIFLTKLALRLAQS